MEIFELTCQVMFGSTDSQLSYKSHGDSGPSIFAADSEGWMHISAILYALYLIFGRGGRLNQHRLSSGQSASRQCAPHQNSPLFSSILHSDEYLCVFFIIFSKISMRTILTIWESEYDDSKIMIIYLPFLCPDQPPILQNLPAKSVFTSVNIFGPLVIVSCV